MLKKTVNVSCVIPVLNEEQYLPILLNSIVHQDVAPREIIVADAGSRDRTVEIAKSFGCKIVPGGSVPKGRNSGGFSAIGDYILFLDADVKVYYLPEVILERDKERRVLRSQSATQAMNDAVVAKKRPGPSGGVSSLAHCGVASRLCATVGTLPSSRLALTSNLGLQIVNLIH